MKDQVEVSRATASPSRNDVSLSWCVRVHVCVSACVGVNVCKFMCACVHVCVGVCVKHTIHTNLW